MNIKAKNRMEKGVLEHNGGTLHYWCVRDYGTRLARGENKRDIEQSEVRMKLAELGYDTPLAYKPTGQPCLEENKEVHLSISHAKDQMVIYVSDHPVGVDVEFERESMFDGRSYFVNDEEESGGLTAKRLQLIWGAKEAFFKQQEGKIEDLKNDVTIGSIDYPNEWLELHYKGTVFHLRFRIWEKLYLVFTS